MVTCERVRRHFAELGMGDALRRIGDDESLLLGGVLDSVGMIDLISELERVYAISISEDDMTPENFETISAIQRYLTHRLSSQ